MRFPPAILDEIRARLPVSQVVARRVKLKRQGREYAGLSPFKAEKTPSFTVNDQKGFYHCFSSGEHGDIFKFVMATEGLSFIEAVERLAKDAGVSLPKPDRRDEAREAEFERLRRVAEASAAFFEERLRSGEGREARDYLDRRGVSEAEIAHFRLGYAPQSRDKLKAHLAGMGFSAEEAARAGMLIAGEDIATPYDRFRHRLMFPIRDMGGGVIAFGGRALAADQQPKYLNSPETPLFHKGSVLFNAHAARKAAHETGAVIVAEGYMDVIALTRAGFANAVAPLGTALTEEQLRLLWRMAEEPVVCLDGDAAGRKAAHRALETALPHIRPGASLRFAFLPDGLDPDDLLRASGPEAVAAAISSARPLIDVLWTMETTGAPATTPEARQAVRARLLARAARIEDKGLAAEYRRALSERWWAHFNQPKPQADAGRKPRGKDANDRRPGQRGATPRTTPPPSESLLRSSLLNLAPVSPREAAMLLALLNHPFLIEEEAEDIAALHFDSPGLNALRDAIIDIAAAVSPLDKDELRDQLTRRGLRAILAQVDGAITHHCEWHTQPDAPRRSVVIGWRHMMALNRKSSLKAELEAAKQAFADEQTEETYLRLIDLNRQLTSGDGYEANIEGYLQQEQDNPPREQLLGGRVKGALTA
ncbi:MAG: DNA primase [Hyphomicrobiales bacterium]|nr:DNA primase [Hyphomicrobiales bacterium]